MIRFFAIYHKGNGKQSKSNPHPENSASAPKERAAEQTPLTENEILEDMLASQQQISVLYNSRVADCKNDTLKNEMLGILREEHNLHTEVYTELTKRGAHTDARAPQNKIDETKREFGSSETQNTV